MKPYEIENWVLRVIERINKGQPCEDSRVELKTDWPDPQKAARQIAGHANAARGESILWIIGVDEKTGVIGASNEELANWYPRVAANFVGITPTVFDLNIPFNDSTVVGLLFDTSRIPYVVKNPAYGSQGGGPVQLEVPWRENRSTKSASRSDLIKLLSPLGKLPSIEVLAAELKLYASKNQNNSKAVESSWELNIDLYVVPPSFDRVVIPFHRCSAFIEIEDCINRTYLNEFSLAPPSRMVLGGRGGISSEVDSVTVLGTSNEVIVEGPGVVELSAKERFQTEYSNLQADAKVTVILTPSEAESSINLDIILTSLFSIETKKNNWMSRWVYKTEKHDSPLTYTENA